jgi:hypothetical protein
VILRLDADIDALQPITPAELAAGFPAPELRQQFINGAMVTSLADGGPARETVAKMADLPRRSASTRRCSPTCGFSPSVTCCCSRSISCAVAISRRHEEPARPAGPARLAKSVLTMRGVMEDPALAARYRAWEKLPPDTLGHQVIAFYNKHGFSVPGERLGFPEAGLYHDFCHVLGDYRTEPEGEIQVAAFASGFMGTRPIYIVLFVVLIFSAGVDMRPTGGEEFATIGALGEPGMAERMFAAIERGAQVKQDLSDKWDYWTYADLPIDEVRQRLNILPKG